MINDRFVWYQESNGFIFNLQCGFWNKRSTNDYLIRLETTIREVFIRKELEKTYDTTWKYEIMRDLYDLSKRQTSTLYQRVPIRQEI